jgi:hypothetical protein
VSYDLTQYLNGLAAGIEARKRAAIDAANEFAEHIGSEAQELVPVSPTDPKHPLYIGTSGALRDSFTVMPAEINLNGITVELGYNTDYAAAVHERPDAVHRYPGAVNPGAQWKYLEDPMRENNDKFGPFVAEKIAEVGGA